MSKVIVRIKGGLGNQLFCYAAARRLALINNVELVIDDVTGFIHDHKFRRKYMLDNFQISARKATPNERMEPLERYRRGVAKFIAHNRPFYLRSYIEQEGREFDQRLLDLKIKKSVYLEGYWQSEKYFKDVEEVIRGDLQIIPPQDEPNRRMAERILSCNAIAVHVRFFNSSNVSNPSRNLEENYYRQAIREISTKVENPRFFLFSDNIREAKKIVGLSEDKITCISHNCGDENAYKDLWLMAKCKHFIIANSTFSWWGAWLGLEDGKIEKIIIAYDNYFYKDTIPENWIII